MSLKPIADEREELAAQTERIRQICNDLDTTLRDAARQRQLIGKLRAEADRLCRVFESGKTNSR